MNIMVVGCGRVGSQLATMFSSDDHNVVVVDRNVRSFERLGKGFDGQTVVGNGTEEDVLVRAGINEADVLAAVTSNDNANLMTAEIARKLYAVPRVITRLYNPVRESSYTQLGIDYVCGTTLVAEEVYAKVQSGHGNHIEVFGEFEILRFSLNLSREKKDFIHAQDLEREHDIRVIAFERRDGSASSIPTKDSILYHGDTLLVCVRHDLIGRLSRYMKTK